MDISMESLWIIIVVVVFVIYFTYLGCIFILWKRSTSAESVERGGRFTEVASDILREHLSERLLERQVRRMADTVQQIPDHTQRQLSESSSREDEVRHLDEIRSILLRNHRNHILASFLESLNQNENQQPVNLLPTEQIQSLVRTTLDNIDVTNLEPCPICMEAYTVEIEVTRLKPCLHVFHTSCIETWLSMSGSCPNCRTIISPTQNSGGLHSV